MDLFAKSALVAFGSALGGLSRWAASLFVARLLGTVFPWGTLSINLLGSLFLGWFMTVCAKRFPENGWGWLRPDDLRLLVAIGFTGAFTTFSTFEYEAHGQFQDGQTLLGLTYLTASVMLGLLAVHLGGWLAQAV